MSSVFATVAMLEYHDISRVTMAELESRRQRKEAVEVTDRPLRPTFTEEEIALRVAVARREAETAIEERLRREYEARSRAEADRVTRALESFTTQRSDYFLQVEAEVVQLALSISRRILNREAKIDPLMMGAVVRIALEQLQEGSKITLRVSVGTAAAWRAFFAGSPHATTMQIVEDGALSDEDCWLETEMGSANFNVEEQLKRCSRALWICWRRGQRHGERRITGTVSPHARAAIASAMERTRFAGGRESY